MNIKNEHQKQLKNIQHRITDACDKSRRDKQSVQLIGASKTKPANLIRSFFDLGLTNFGENYLNEAIEKQEELIDLDITWHYIGHVQSNKTKVIANHFDWVHGVDRLKIAQRLNDQNTTGKILNILIQLNLDNEKSKAGIPLKEALSLAKEINQLPNISFRGFMALPKPREHFDEQKECLMQLKDVLDEINQILGINLDTISAGMSNDLEAAIAAGTTMVRVGSDLFGARS